MRNAITLSKKGVNEGHPQDRIRGSQKEHSADTIPGWLLEPTKSLNAGSRLQDRQENLPRAARHCSKCTRINLNGRSILGAVVIFMMRAGQFPRSALSGRIVWP